MKKQNMGSSFKSIDKRVPRNPRYEGITAQVDSGFNEIKLGEKFDLGKLNARFRRDENFRRLKTTTLARFVSNEEEVDFLLLDVRDQEDFKTCQINNALNYPAPMLSRSVNNFTPEILAFSNKESESKIIVIYDFDERVAGPAGNLFFEKGVDNVFLLSGGLKKFGAEFPELCEGVLPAPPSPTGTNKSKMSTHSNASHRSVRSVVTSYAPSHAPSNISNSSSTPSGAHWK
mmetsp:Transcript_44453/g.85030  ORF Transcript_44453/g.85030 Transcript_44453/m.85030 type:complete len:231 (+) Transcript_44453:129-821(+)